MPKKLFTNDQITFALRQAENGTLVVELGRKMGVAEARFYRWKNVYAGMTTETHRPAGRRRAGRRNASVNGGT